MAALALRGPQPGLPQDSAALMAASTAASSSSWTALCAPPPDIPGPGGSQQVSGVPRPASASAEGRDKLSFISISPCRESLRDLGVGVPSRGIGRDGCQAATGRDGAHADRATPFCSEPEARGEASREDGCAGSPSAASSPSTGKLRNTTPSLALSWKPSPAESLYHSFPSASSTNSSAGPLVRSSSALILLTSSASSHASIQGSCPDRLATADGVSGGPIASSSCSCCLCDWPGCYDRLVSAGGNKGLGADSADREAVGTEAVGKPRDSEASPQGHEPGERTEREPLGGCDGVEQGDCDEFVGREDGGGGEGKEEEELLVDILPPSEGADEVQSEPVPQSRSRRHRGTSSETGAGALGERGHSLSSPSYYYSLLKARAGRWWGGGAPVPLVHSPPGLSLSGAAGDSTTSPSASAGPGISGEGKAVAGLLLPPPPPLSITMGVDPRVREYVLSHAPAAGLASSPSSSSSGGSESGASSPALSSSASSWSSSPSSPATASSSFSLPSPRTPRPVVPYGGQCSSFLKHCAEPSFPLHPLHESSSDSSSGLTPLSSPSSLSLAAAPEECLAAKADEPGNDGSPQGYSPHPWVKEVFCPPSPSTIAPSSGSSSPDFAAAAESAAGAEGGTEAVTEAWEGCDFIPDGSTAQPLPTTLPYPLHDLLDYLSLKFLLKWKQRFFLTSGGGGTLGGADIADLLTAQQRLLDAARPWLAREPPAGRALQRLFIPTSASRGKNFLGSLEAVGRLPGSESPCAVLGAEEEECGEEGVERNAATKVEEGSRRVGSNVQHLEEEDQGKRLVSPCSSMAEAAAAAVAAVDSARLARTAIATAAVMIAPPAAPSAAVAARFSLFPEDRCSSRDWDGRWRLKPVAAIMSQPDFAQRSWQVVCCMDALRGLLRSIKPSPDAAMAASAPGASPGGGGRTGLGEEEGRLLDDMGQIKRLGMRRKYHSMLRQGLGLEPPQQWLVDAQAAFTLECGGDRKKGDVMPDGLVGLRGCPQSLSKEEGEEGEQDEEWLWGPMSARWSGKGMEFGSWLAHVALHPEQHLPSVRERALRVVDIFGGPHLVEYNVEEYFRLYGDSPIPRRMLLTTSGALVPSHAPASLMAAGLADDTALLHQEWLQEVGNITEFKSWLATAKALLESCHGSGPDKGSAAVSVARDMKAWRVRELSAFVLCRLKPSRASRLVKLLGLSDQEARMLEEGYKVARRVVNLYLTYGLDPKFQASF